jgi:hypothetical protein
MIRSTGYGAIITGPGGAARGLAAALPGLGGGLEPADRGRWSPRSSTGHLASVGLMLELGFPIDARREGVTPLLDAGAPLEGLTLKPDEPKQAGAAVLELVRSHGLAGDPEPDAPAAYSTSRGLAGDPEPDAPAAYSTSRGLAGDPEPDAPAAYSTSRGLAGDPEP